MAKNDIQYGGWNSYTLQCGTIVTLISPGDCTLQCGMWLWEHDSEFTKWQHPALWYVTLGSHAIEFARLQHPTMWHVAVGSWHWIRQMAARCNVAADSGMTSHRIRPNVRHIGILHLVSISTISLLSTCHSAPVCEVLSKSDCPRHKKWRHVDFQYGGYQPSWILGVPIIGCLKNPCSTSYRSSIETMALNCSVFEKIAFWQTDGQHRCTKPLSL